MTNTYETTQIKLNTLVIHPDNVRSKSSASYTAEAVTNLSANIAECGLLQPLLVQKISKNKFGVLAGGRRLTALKALAAIKDNEFAKDMLIDCRIVADDMDATTTLSFSENHMQLPMDALDRFEAFSGMFKKDGAGVADIARTFGITELVVKQSLRLGNIHPDIRDAHRNGDLSLDTLRAFDAHPDIEVQLSVYKRLSANDGTMYPHTIRNALQDGYTRLGDALGQFVSEEYRAKCGAITQDLIEEDSILSDTPLIDAVLAQKLSDLAEDERARLGLSWAETAINPSWDDFDTYGRVYPSIVELDAKTQATVDNLQARADELAGLSDKAEDWDERHAFDKEHKAIMDQIDDLTHGYSEADAANSGVIAIWRSNGLSFEAGMVRKEDQQSENVSGADGAQETDDVTAPKAKVSEALRRDMAHVRSRGVALALAQSPSSARDFADFVLICKVVQTEFRSYTTSTNISCERASRGPDDVTGSLALIEDSMQSVKQTLDLGWTACETQGEAFALFRDLSQDAREALLAYAVAQTLVPSSAPDVYDDVAVIIEDEVLPNVRDVWTPDEAYLKRLTKPDLLNILSVDLGLAQEAKSMEGFKKSGVVEYLVGLFSEPFATLTKDQIDCVNAWCPDYMQRPSLGADNDVEAMREDDLKAA